MRLAHILVCHSTDPTEAIESIPHMPDSLWYVFLHSADADVENVTERLIACRGGNIFPYKTNRGLSRSWNEGLHLAFEAGCDAALLLNDDLFFYADGYRKFRETIEIVRSISRNVSHVTVLGLETGVSHHSGEIIPQNFACCAIMRETIDKIGYFDEFFSPAYYEDVDFARRAALAGMTLHLDDRVLTEHQRSSTFNKMTEETRGIALALQEKNRLYFARKWGSHDDPQFRVPFNDPRYNLKISFEGRIRPYDL